MCAILHVTTLVLLSKLTHPALLWRTSKPGKFWCTPMPWRALPLLRPSRSQQVLPIEGNLWHQLLGNPSNSFLSILAKKKISHHVVEVLLVPIFVYRANWKATKITIVFLTFLYYCSLCVGALRFIGPSPSLVSMLDEFSQVLRTLPLRNKLETSPTLLRFYTYVLTQFHVPIKCINVTTVLAKLQSSYLSQD